MFFLENDVYSNNCLFTVQTKDLFVLFLGDIFPDEFKRFYTITKCNLNKWLSIINILLIYKLKLSILKEIPHKQVENKMENIA